MLVREICVRRIQQLEKVIFKFRVHEASQMHRESCIKLDALKQKSIVAHFSDMKSNDQKRNREMFKKVLNSLKYLLWQGLPIGGHHEEEGYLIQLLKCQSEDVDGLKTFLMAKNIFLMISDRHNGRSCVTRFINDQHLAFH